MRTITTTAKLPKSIHQKAQVQVIQDGYGMRGKNKWINEAIEDLLNQDNFPELVDIADGMEEMTDVISVRLSELLMNKLDDAVIEVRKFYPGMEGVKSNIIRASLVQRLIRGKLRLPKLFTSI